MAETETQEYEILNDPIGDKGPGDTIELAPGVADSFSDNLIPAGEERPDDAIRSQFSQRRVTTLADLINQGEEIEDGEYEVYRDAIADTEPGDTIEVTAPVARAYADNLLAPEESSPDAVETADADGPSESENDDFGDPDDSESDESFDAEGETKSYGTPEEMLDQNVEEVQDDIDAAGLSERQLRDLREAEIEGEERSGVIDHIDEQLE